MSELLNRLPDGGGWTVLAVVAIIIFGPVSLFSRATIQEKFGGLGLLARWVRAGRRRAIEEAAATESVTVAMLNQQIATFNEALSTQEKRHADDVARINRRFGQFQEEAERRERDSKRRELRLAGQLENAMDYISWSTSWARAVLLWAAEKGYILPPPEWKTFPEWLRDTRDQTLHLDDIVDDGSIPD